MKRNVIVILTLALVCVLFVACGKEEVAPIDAAIVKTREEMTEAEREAYDRAKIEEFAEQVKNDPSIDVEAMVESGAIHNMGYYYEGNGEDGGIPMYIPNLDELPEEYKYLAMPSVVVATAFPDAITSDEWNFLHDYLVDNPEYLVPLAKINYKWLKSLHMEMDESGETITVMDEAIRNEFIVAVRNIVDNNKSAG